MFYVDQDLPWQTIDGNSKRKVMAVGESLMFVKVAFTLKSEEAITVHRHPHEQMTYVLKGAFLFKIGQREQVVKAGDSLSFLPNQEHGCIPLEDKSELLDAFTPIRDDFLLI